MSFSNNKHNIKSLLFDIIFDDERRAQELYDDIHRLHYQDLEQVICLCLDQYSTENSFVKIEELELDLGLIHYQDLNTQMVQRVYDALSKKLKILFEETSSKKRLKISATANKISLLRHFLLNGFLPWNTKENVIDLITYCLENEKKELVQLLRSIGHLTKVRKRLVSRVSNGLIERVFDILISFDCRTIIQLHHQLLQVVQQHRLLNIPISRLENDIWLFMLNFILLHPQASNNPNLFIKDTLIQFCEKYQIPFSDILLLLTDRIEKSESENILELKKNVFEISKDLKIQGFKNKKQRNSFVRLSKEEKTKLLISLLFNKSDFKKNKNVEYAVLQQHFLQLLNSEPEVILELLDENSKVDFLVVQINRFFGLKPIYALVKSLESSHFNSIINFQKDLFFTHQKEPVASVPEKTFSENLWIAIIKILLNRSGSYFNKLAFLKNLIGELASHYNVDFQTLLLRLQRIACLISTKSSTMPDFIHLLERIYFENSDPKSREIFLLDNKSFVQPSFKNADKDNLPNENQDLGFIKKRNKKVLSNYFQKKENNSASLSFIKTILIESLKFNPKWVLETIKRQSNYIEVVERLVYDFDEELIQVLIKAVAPLNYQIIIDYQKVTLLIQKKEQILKASPTELSDALWGIILKMLLIRSTTRFNQKSFLRKLLVQTAAHFNIKYLKLLNQLCSVKVKNDFDAPNYHLFIQLIMEIQAEEQTTPKKIKEHEDNSIHSKKERINSKNSKKAKAKPKNSDSLFDLILLGSLDSTMAFKQRGFASMDEAILHLVLYQKDALIKKLRKASSSQVQHFITHLSEERREVLLQAAQAGFAIRILDFIKNLNQRLYEFGFQNRLALMRRVKEKCLFFMLKNPANFLDKLLSELSHIIDEYDYPPGFFEEKKAWQIPIKGDLENNIRDLEDRFSRELESALLSKSKAALLVEEMLELSRQKNTGVTYQKKKQVPIDQEIYISNAGLVIFNGYLNYFFEQCDYLDEDGLFLSGMANRAALVLQYVFDPEGFMDEEEMVLNKIICGIPIHEVLPVDFEINENEMEISEQMIDAIISHWKMINNSSREGFRESWLHREGKLIKKEKHWELLVEKRTFDILLDYKPFTISPVKFQWMKKAINVNWR